MENRLELNKKPKYELPDEVKIGWYRRYYNMIPFDNPDLCIGGFGKGCLGRVYAPKSVAMEIWIKTNNKELIEFIKGYNFEENKTGTGTSKRCITLNELKKIILEEFYGGKYEE